MRNQQPLTPDMQRFVLHWGEMGAKWGINRSVAQIHALLYLARDPLPAEIIASTLSIARSNVSNSLRELQGWGIVRVTHVMGDRRDHFECMKDVWDMFLVIFDERKRREIDPTLAMLRELAAVSKRGDRADAHVHERITAMMEFFDQITSWYAQFRRLPKSGMLRFARAGEKLRRWLG